jgi:hypothetical protein
MVSENTFFNFKLKCELSQDQKIQKQFVNQPVDTSVIYMHVAEILLYC